MIQANELRIGNWIKSNIVFVTNPLTEKLIVCDEDFLEVLFAARNYNDYNPILLTSDILGKCGFEIQKDKFKIKDLFLTTWDNDTFIMLRQDGYDIYPAMPLIKSLHQLQNLYFALRGEELEVTL